MLELERKMIADGTWNCTDCRNMIRINETLCDCCIEWVEFSMCNCGGKEFRLTEQIKTNKNERI